MIIIRKYGCPIVASGQTTKETLIASTVAWLSIVACLSVAIATVVNKHFLC
jgi:hypothetical protein